MKEDACIKVESLMVWIHDRPAMYAQLVGELDTALWYLHMVWAKMADREREYNEVRNQVGNFSSLSILAETERIQNTDKNDPITQKVLAFWAAINARLGIRIRCDAWMDLPPPNPDPLSPEA